MVRVETVLQPRVDQAGRRGAEFFRDLVGGLAGRVEDDGPGEDAEVGVGESDELGMLNAE